MSGIFWYPFDVKFSFVCQIEMFKLFFMTYLSLKFLMWKVQIFNVQKN